MEGLRLLVVALELLGQGTSTETIALRLLVSGMWPEMMLRNPEPPIAHSHHSGFLAGWLLVEKDALVKE